MTTFVYLVLPEVSPGVGILLLCGVFFFQICIDIVKTPNWYWGQGQGCCARAGERNGYDALPLGNRQNLTSCNWETWWTIFRYFVCIVQVLFENKIAKAVALLLQLVGIFGFIGMWVVNVQHLSYNMVRPMVGYPLAIFVLSVIWSNFYQEKIADAHNPRRNQENQDITARFKSSN